MTPSNPATLSNGAPYLVMCCGCKRLMTQSGGTVEYANGYVDFTPLPKFATYAEADAYAAAHGWQVADAHGSNHRCPECLRNGSAHGDRGAYIQVPAIPTPAALPTAHGSGRGPDSAPGSSPEQLAIFKRSIRPRVAQSSKSPRGKLDA